MMGQGQGDPGSGGTGGQGEGYGEAPTLAFRYRLVGYSWSWTDKSSPDPRLWKAEGAEYDISATDYVFGSAQDALDAGKAAGEADTAVVRVFAEANLSGFAGLQYTWTDRHQAAVNQAAKEKDAATEEYFKEGAELDLKPGVSPWLGLIVIAIIIIGILWFLPKLGPSKEIVAPVKELV